MIIFLLYVPTMYFASEKVGKLAVSSFTMLPFRRVSLWRHNNFTCESGRVVCHPPPCEWQASHSGQIVLTTLWSWEKSKSTAYTEVVWPNHNFFLKNHSPEKSRSQQLDTLWNQQYLLLVKYSEACLYQNLTHLDTCQNWRHKSPDNSP